MEEIIGKRATLSVERPEALMRISHALSSDIRLRVLLALGKQSRSVGELADQLGAPLSTVALAVRTLEGAGLITCRSQPGIRGSMKLCSRRVDAITIDLEPHGGTTSRVYTMEMPVGGYTSADGIRPVCGLADGSSYIGSMDTPHSFYLPDRFGAQLVWFQQGFLEYRFSALEDAALVEIEWLELSFEACSEAPMYRDPWRSDIVVEVNGKRLGMWTSPCDCGGRRGRLTPAWWGGLSTQFGFLKTWRVDGGGAYLDGARVGDTTLGDLTIGERPYIVVRIGVPGDAEHVGGMNLFGERFGDYPQPIVMRIGYSVR